MSQRRTKLWIIALGVALSVGTFRLIFVRLPTGSCGEIRFAMGDAKAEWMVKHAAAPTKEQILSQFFDDYRADFRSGNMSWQLRRWPTCPEGGEIRVNGIGEGPSCSIHGTLSEQAFQNILDASTQGRRYP